jgi:phage head maturation protease
VTGREIVRQVLHAQLLEVSPVTFPAYPQTSAQVRDRVAALRVQPPVPDDINANAVQRARDLLRINIRELELLP